MNILFTLQGAFINYDLGAANQTHEYVKFFGSPLRESRDNDRSPLCEHTEYLGPPPTTSTLLKVDSFCVLTDFMGIEQLFLYNRGFKSKPNHLLFGRMHVSRNSTNRCLLLFHNYSFIKRYTYTLRYMYTYKSKKKVMSHLDVDVSPPASIISFS